MATFAYQALTSAGRLMKGTLEAGSPDQAAEALRQMGLTVNSVEAAPPPRPRSRIGRAEFALFNQQLASIAKAGIPLERSLRELAGDVDSRRMRRLIEAVAADLEAGEPIEAAFEKHSRHFPPMYGQILAAGVKTGRLSEMLTSLNRHLEISAQTRHILFEAACYPAVVLALAAVVLTVLYATVVPRFRPIYEEWGARLPPATELVLAASDNVLNIWLCLAAAAVAAVVAKLLLSRCAAGRRFLERLLINAPVVGRIYRNTALARLADALAVLVGTGCDLPEGLRLAASASGSENLRRECGVLAERIEQGSGIWEAGAGCRLIPRLFLYSIEWGSHRGELADNLYGLAEMCSQRARTNQGRLQGLLTPVLLVLVGGVIALTVVTVFLPIPTLVQSMQGR